jgi:GT2 family glycosyltransferase
MHLHKGITMNEITVVIPLYNSEAYIEKCLDSLACQTYDKFKVFLIDNQDQKHNQFVQKYHPKLKIEYIPFKENIGWTGANNYALRKCTTRYAFLLNADTHLEKDCLFLINQFAISHTDLILMSPEILEYNDSNYSGDGFPLSFDFESGLISAYLLEEKSIEVNFVPGTAMLIDLSKIPQEDLYFKEDFFMYHEDVEFSIRMILGGYGKLYFAKGPKVAHSSTQSFNRVQTCQLAVRNCLYCLSYYQTKKDYRRNSFNYCLSFAFKYISYYWKFYPVAFPYFFSKYLIQFILSCDRKFSHDQADVERFKYIHSMIDAKCQKKFSFVF